MFLRLGGSTRSHTQTAKSAQYALRNWLRVQEKIKANYLVHLFHENTLQSALIFCTLESVVFNYATCEVRARGEAARRLPRDPPAPPSRPTVPPAPAPPGDGPHQPLTTVQITSASVFLIRCQSQRNLRPMRALLLIKKLCNLVTN